MINFILSGLFEDFNGLDTNRDEQHFLTYFLPGHWLKYYL